jgi:hyaluronan synthase
MYTFLLDASRALGGAGFTLFMGFFAYVWLLWLAKSIAARRYRPFSAKQAHIMATVIVPVFNEPEPIFRRVLASVRANLPAELIVVVDGGDEHLAQVAGDYSDRVLRIPKAGKRLAIAAGFEAADPLSQVIVVVDSDTVWERDTLAELMQPFADPRVGGVTPRQAVFDPHSSAIRRLSNWIEDLRYSLTVPAQSIFGQIGCLAGRTIAYRRIAFAAAVEPLVRQKLFGVAQHVGDDRVLTNELLRNGWRTVYQSTARVETDAPATWRGFWRQQLRWARSSQRETILSLPWLWRRPVACTSFLADMLTPFALYAVLALAVAHAVTGRGAQGGMDAALEIPLGYAGMVASIGIRQIPHLRRAKRDIFWLPLFVLQLTFVMTPIRIAGFATMLHHGWSSRSAPRLTEVLHEAPRPQPAQH